MKKEVLDKMLALVTAAFGLVAALAWNDAIQAVFKAVFGSQSSIPAMLGYATFVTIVAVVVTVYMGRLVEKAGKLEKAR